MNTKNKKIQISNLYVLPYTPNHNVAKEFPGFNHFKQRSDFLVIDSIKRLGVVFFIENLKYGSSRPAICSFRANVFNSERQIVASMDFSVRMEPEELNRYHRIDIPFFGDTLTTGEYSVEISILGSDATEVSKSFNMYRCPKLPLRYFNAEEAYFLDNETRYISVDTYNKTEAVVKMRFTHSFHTVADKLPELSVRIIDGIEDDPEEFPAEIEVISDSEFILTANIRLTTDLPRVALLQVKAFGLRMTGFAFETTYSSEGVLTSEDIVYISEFNVEKGDAEIERRNERLRKRQLECEDENAETMLKNMVGLENIKDAITAQTNFVKFNSLREKANLPAISRPLHSLFLGAPGTGKTSVAKIIGRLLHKAGALSKGHVVFRERANLVGKYYGTESENILAALEDAEGGILFIDEAYQLYQPNDPKDPGLMVLNSLLTVLANPEKRDWMLILAGYTKPIMEMLEQNPGINSRFPETNRYEFRDFSVEELIEIALRFLSEHKLTLSDSARKKLEYRITIDFANRDESFGNARYVINLLETEVIPAMANRICNAKAEPVAEKLSLILESDILEPAKKATSTRIKIGFRGNSAAGILFL